MKATEKLLNHKAEMKAFFISTVKTQLGQIVGKNLLSVSEAQKLEINEQFKNFATDRYNSAIKLASKESGEADFMGGLDRKKPVVHTLVKQAYEISFKHSCLQFSKEILKNVLNFETK